MASSNTQVERLLKHLTDSNPSLVMSGQDAATQSVLAELDRIGKLTVKDDSILFKGTKFVLPEQYTGDYLGAAEFLKQIHKQEEEETSFIHEFKYRPWDGAAAFDRAMYRVFGTVGLGKATQSFFGTRPPMRISVAVGPNETLQVPWGEVSMPVLDATFDLMSTYDEEYGQLFAINVVAPRKHRERIDAFFSVVEDELKERSIYRGKAFNGAEKPEFLDLSWVSEDKVVYSQETLNQLNANVWSLIEHTDAMRSLGIPLKRAVLLEGPFGTGKTLAGALTAQKANENGWTFILARPGKDDLFEVLNTAKLYAPAVVQFEDIDTIAKGGSDLEISRLLDALDGIGNKGNGVVALFTTNYVDRIQKAVMRPGRIDSIIHIGHLDRPGVEKLIKSVTKSEILGNIDYDVVFAEVQDFLPAFIKETVDRAVRYSLSRNGGVPDTIETDDLIGAANGLKRQLELMAKAQEGSVKAPELETAFKGLFTDAVRQQVQNLLNDTVTLDEYGDRDGKLRVK